MVVQPLFYLQLSGTHASIDQRLRAVETWLCAGDPPERAPGMRTLSAMYEAYRFTSSYNFDFGARPGNHHYRRARLTRPQALQNAGVRSRLLKSAGAAQDGSMLPYGKCA